MVIHMAILIT